MLELIRYFIGTALMRELPGHKNKALRTMQRNGIRFFDLRMSDGAVYFRIFRRSLRSAELLEHAEIVSEKGFFIYLKKSLSRPGLYIGAVIFIIGLALSDSILWDVRFIRNGSENADRIKQTAAECGLVSGALKTRVDKKSIENMILMKCPDVSYVKINYEGNVATVVTDERILPAPVPDDGIRDLTASEDGYIIRFETYAGRTVCTKGQTVRRGDVLISGTYDTFHHGTAQVRARGRVYALVRRSFVCEVPMTVSEKIYTGKQTTKNGFRIFSFDTDGDADAKPPNCDVTTRESAVTVFGFIELPLMFKSTTYREFVLSERTIGKDEAEKELEKQYAIQYADVTAGAFEIRDNKRDFYTEDGKYKLYCEVWLVCDIAK